MTRLIFLLCLCVTQNAFAAELQTIAERSDYVETGRYAEVETLCAAFESAYPERVKCHNFGTTPQGRPMLALVASDDQTFSPELVAKRGRPVMLAQGGIHAGEIDGKDAGFRLLRDVLEGNILPGALSNLTFVFVPVFNIDGHERFSAFHRPNQIGPKEMGFRATAQNYNLNRDYVKADAPEMRAMLKLLWSYDPAIYVDLHVTDGAQFQHDISITMEPTHMQDERVQEIGRAIRKRTVADLNAKGAKALEFYPDFTKEDDPTSGFAVGAPPPRFSHGYWGTRGRFGVLVETHSWKDYKTRVQRTYDALVSLFGQCASEGAAWISEFTSAEEREKQLGGKAVSLSLKNTPHKTTINFLGYAYTKTPSPISGALQIRYDTSRPEVWNIPLYDNLTPDVSATAPRVGYIVAPEWADLIARRLTLHHIAFSRLELAIEKATTSQFRATSWKWSPQSFEGRQTLKSLEGTWEKGPSRIEKGALFIPISQPKVRLLMALVEPQAPDSFVAWGDFNPVFEQKEYIESYVLEPLAKKMLADDASLRKEFEQKVNSDSKFKSDPDARRDFFYRRSPYRDTHMGVHPIRRLEAITSQAPLGQSAVPSQS